MPCVKHSQSVWKQASITAAARLWDIQPNERAWASGGKLGKWFQAGALSHQEALETAALKANLQKLKI